MYASFGTLQNRRPDSFRMVAEACAGTGHQVVISTGHGVAPGALAGLPGGPIVVGYAPQRELLARAALAVTHAGLNTVLDALGAGVPLVAVPVTNEQPGIAARVAWAGAGEVLPPGRATAGRLRDLVGRVGREGSYRAAAVRVADSIRSGGGAERAAELVEKDLLA
ncbi:glycosyltransferase [Tautonia plasticadhaerens]